MLKTFETELELPILMADSCLQIIYQIRSAHTRYTLKKKKVEVQNPFHGLVTILSKIIESI